MVFLKSNYSQPLKMYVGSQCPGFVPFGAAASSNQAPCKRCSVLASTPPFGFACVVICWQQKIATYGLPCTWLLHCGAEAWEKGHGWDLHNCVQWGEETGAGTEQLLVTPKEGPWQRLHVLDKGGSSWVWATSHRPALTSWRSHSRGRGAHRESNPHVSS